MSSPSVGDVEGTDWIIVAVLVLVLFGGTQIPRLARSLGQAQAEFKKGIAEGASGEPDDGDASQPKG